MAGKALRGMVWWGAAWQAWQGTSRLVKARRCLAGKPIAEMQKRPAPYGAGCFLH